MAIPAKHGGAEGSSLMVMADGQGGRAWWTVMADGHGGRAWRTVSRGWRFGASLTIASNHGGAVTVLLTIVLRIDVQCVIFVSKIDGASIVIQEVEGGEGGRGRLGGGGLSEPSREEMPRVDVAPIAALKRESTPHR